MANGKFGGGNGTAANPYLIEDIADLNAIRSTPTLYYKLINNLDMKGSSFSDATKGWTPISNFSGYFNGNYHNIRNLTINDTTLNNAGLFGNFQSGGQIHNLGLIDVSIIANNSVGSFAGSFNDNNCTIDTCYVNGTISGNRDVGGIVGQSRSRNNNVIKNIVCDCKVTGTSDNVGGIAGEFTSITDDTKQSTMNTVFFYGTIKGDNYITTNPIAGLEDDLTKYTNCLYDSDKISTNYPDEKGEGHETKYFYNTNNFDSLISITYQDYDTTHPTPLWKFSLTDYPRLGFSNKKYVLFQIDKKYNFFNKKTQTFEEITTTPITTNDFITKGIFIDEVKNINTNLLHDVCKNHTFQIYLYFDSYSANLSLPTVIVFSDKEDDGKKIKIVTISHKNNLDNDFNPISSTAKFVTINKKEITTFPIYIDNENNNKFDKELKVENKILFDVKSENTNDIDLIVQSNSHNNTDSTSTFNDSRNISIISSKANELKGINVKVGAETNIPLKTYKSPITNIIYDKENEKSNVKGNVFYTLYNTITTQNRGIHVNAEGENKSKYLLSVSNGSTWLKYDTNTNTWINEDLNNIYNNGMTASQFQSRAIMNALPTNYKSKIKYAACISAEAFNTTFTIKNLNIEFEPNNGPTILEAASQLNNNQVTVSGIVFDNENDNIKYRILSKHQIETNWKQLVPSSGEWFNQKNNYNFKHSFPLSTFKNGTNAIKIQTQDSRGAKYEKIISFTLIEGTPEIKINSNNQFYANATITHTQNKKVHYKIFINGIQKAPLTGWTEFKQTPFTFDYTWQTKDVLNGLPNEIEIIVEDEMQSQTFTKFNIIGEYKSLLFKDENNFYYSTDTGDILQQLDFGTVVGGVLSNIYPVWLENKTGLPMENITIYADSTTQENLSKIKLSFTNNDTSHSFNSSESIVYDKIMENNDVIKFYVRIESDETVKSLKNKIFRVLAKGEPIDSTVDNPYVTQDTYIKLINNYNILNEGIGLYNITINGLNDTMGINNKNIFLIYDTVFISDPTKITKEEFLNSPITTDILNTTHNEYLAKNKDYQAFSIDWINDFFRDNYNDTFDNLVLNNKLSYKAKLEYNQYYDAHYAWLKANNTNKTKIFTHTWVTK